MEGICTKCGGPTDGYKCDVCSAEFVEHDANHHCGSDHSMPKCGSCGQAEVKCTCPSVQ